MFKAIKKNQVVIIAVAFMLVAAGYLNFSMRENQTMDTWAEINNQQVSSIGDARLVSSNNVVDNIIEEDEEMIEETSSTVDKNDNYFSESRIERDKMYSEKIETYQAIISQTNVSSEQRSNAQLEISNITNEKNAIMVAENLIKNKGFEDIVIFVNKGSISVVVKADKVEEAQIAQIQSIVQRELDCDVQDIHISNK